MEIKTNVGTSFSLQIFVKLDRNLVCFGTSISKVDTSKPFESVVNNNKFVDDLVNVVIKSLEEIKK